MADQRWQMLPVAFSVTNDVIMKSLTLLKIIYVLSNFFDLMRDFATKVFFASCLL